MKKTTKSAFHRGFTLIELMIVIVILGILMGTILPRLTGAQARARDTGRIADLNTIGQALETYFDDNGAYPGAVGTPVCLVAGELTTVELIKGYLKGSIVPQPASSQVSRWGAAGSDCTGAYVYIPLRNRGIDLNGYALISDVETFQKANILASLLPTFGLTTDTTEIGTTVTDSAVAGVISSMDETDAADTVYVVYN